ncbi:MAG TPA: hypothetical protein VES20_22425 [Bryobacteraceae bacterium]|nr:hypothetical protein [Bryobacteraceae bacterium]
MNDVLPPPATHGMGAVVRVPQPTGCFLCGEPAQIELGMHSYVVDCGACNVHYEVDATAWVAGPACAAALREWIRAQGRNGVQRPVVDLERSQLAGE